MHTSFSPSWLLRSGAAIAVIALAIFLLAPTRGNLAGADGLALTQPRMPRGLTGSLRKLNETLSAGVAPSENAAVALLPIVTLDAFAPSLTDASLQMLGVRSLTPGPQAFHYFPEYVQENPSAHRDAAAAARMQLLQTQLLTAGERPWTREELPEIDEFLTANTAALDAFSKASTADRYYAPLLSEENPPRLLSASLALERRLSFLSHCLVARALLRFANQDHRGALDDLSACHNWARLLATGSPLDVSVAKAHVIDGMAATAERELISRHLRGPEAAVWLQAFLNLPRIPTSDQSADIGERAILQQELELLRTDEESREGLFEQAFQPATAPDTADFTRIDWNLASETLNTVHDDVVRALALRKPADRDLALHRLDEEAAKWQAGVNDWEASFPELIRTDPEAASRSLGRHMAFSLRTNYWQRGQTDDRAAVRRDLVILGLALRAHEHKHGEFPTSLAALAPEWIPEVPLDAHSGEPLVYERPEPHRARMISWGANRMNDAGLNVNDDQILLLE